MRLSIPPLNCNWAPNWSLKTFCTHVFGIVKNLPHSCTNCTKIFSWISVFSERHLTLIDLSYTHKWTLAAVTLISALPMFVRQMVCKNTIFICAIWFSLGVVNHKYDKISQFLKLLFSSLPACKRYSVPLDKCKGYFFHISIRQH